MNLQNAPTEPITRYFSGRSFSDWKQAFDDRGFVIFENVLSLKPLSFLAIRGRAGRIPLYLAVGKVGRNDFEGIFTNRIYALLAKGPVFADLRHPSAGALAFAEAELRPKPAAIVLSGDQSAPGRNGAALALR